MRIWWLPALALLVSRSEGTAQHGYGMIIDAGTMGSRLKIFRWPLGETGGIVFPEHVGSYGTNPGVSTFALNPEKAGPSLDPLIAYAKEALAHLKEEWRLFPIYLRATGGACLLTADEREAVLASVRRRLAECPFLFQDDFALVVTGEERGLYGWLTVNHLLGNLRSDRKITARSSIGALDLAGASMQIAFIPEKSIMSLAFPLLLGPHHLRVYSASFSHFGQREAAHRAASVIITDALLKVQSVDELYHPCFAAGYEYHPRFGYDRNRSFPIDVKMNGSADFQSCELLLRRIFKKDELCLVQSCSFNGVYQPHLYGNKFVAFHDMARIARDLALPSGAAVSDLRVAAEYVCSLSWDQLNIVFARVPDHHARVHLCFHASYVWVLLTYGFGFPPDSRNIDFRSDYNGHVIDYVTGAMIYQINQNPGLLAYGNASTSVLREEVAHPRSPDGAQVIIHS